MKYLKYTLAISLALLMGAAPMGACGPWLPGDAANILMFRCCSPDLERQWNVGCRFQDYEKQENCLLWQRITSQSIPAEDIEAVVYDARLTHLDDLTAGPLANNKFAQWLADSAHRDDLEYIRAAKEIEETRAYMNDPWYYPYEGDEEHTRLAALMRHCLDYDGVRHRARYALQLVRLYFAVGDFDRCIALWENQAASLPRDIVTDMIASYVGGAYTRKGNRDKAIELYTRSQDIGSLISLKAWQGTENRSIYQTDEIRELEYIFNRFPNSPLLSIKLQEYVREKENYAQYSDSKTENFYNELSVFAQRAINNPKCHQKALWNYALGYLHYLDGNFGQALSCLNNAERADATQFLKDSIRAFRFLMNAQNANNGKSYQNRLLQDLKWLDEKMARDADLNPRSEWQFNNKMNWKVCYWQDVARKVLLGTVCPKMKQAGNSVMALQLANYASNRINQLAPLYEAYHFGYDDPDDPESYATLITIDEFRQSWPEQNHFDYSNQFFEFITGASAREAALYGERIANPAGELDEFLNETGYTDRDYISDIIGTLYLREMDYANAVNWLSKVSPAYQNRTNVAKEGYFRRDPFCYQFDKKHHLDDSSEYKLNFAKEMLRLDKVIKSDADANSRANAKIKFAIGLRNSFGKCWYLTSYGFNICYESDTHSYYGKIQTSIDRGGFKDNPYAQKAYKRVDELMAQAVTEFTDPEQAAQAQLDMMNYATLMQKYPGTKAAAYIRSRCDNYHDYALQRR